MKLNVNNDEYYEMLCQAGKREPALLEAARQGNLEWINRLIAEGVSVDCRGVNGSTCLHMAASGVELKAIDFFLRKGHDVNAQNAYGSTPLISLIKGSLYSSAQLKAAQRLLDSGADPRIRDVKGRNALDWAADGRTKLLTILTARAQELDRLASPQAMPE